MGAELKQTELRSPPQKEDSTAKSFSWKEKTRFLVLWQKHQTIVAGVLLAMLIGMVGYFSIQSLSEGGLSDVDNVEARTYEFQVDINSATWGEIVVLPGVGEKLAQAIVAHREQNGPFESLDSLQDVSGIGAKKLAVLRPFFLPLENK